MQVNIDTSLVATIPIVLLSLTHMVVALDIDGKTIHQGFEQAIQNAMHAPHLLEAMQICFNWPDSALEMMTGKLTAN